jgi:hypothetical protein
MASKMALRTPAALRRPLSLSSTTVRRSLSTSATLRQIPRLRSPTTSLIASPKFKQSFRRTYADAPSATLSPPPKPKKRFKFFRFVWRATYLSVLGGLAFMTWTIYDANHPPEQFEPDSSKKTLVILGRCKLPCCAPHEVLTSFRDWLGSCLTVKKVGYRELQCHRCFP